MKKVIKFAIIAAVIFVAILGVILLIATTLLGSDILSALSRWETYLIAGATELGIVVFVVIADLRIQGSRRVLKTNVDLENSHWMTDKEMRENDGFTVTKFSQLGEVEDGIPIKAVKKGKDLNVVIKKGIHTLVIGATGSGKTSAFVSPALEIMCRTKTKPSFVVSDPKGELYKKHSKTFADQGYKVSLIDLSDIMHSTRWNPLADVIKKTQKMNTLTVVFDKGKYYVDGNEYVSLLSAENEKSALKIVYENDIYTDLEDLVFTMCPVESTKDPSWQNGARYFIFSILLALWEDLRDGYLKEEEFNLYTLYKTITEYAVGECEVIKEYMETRARKSKVKGLSNTVLVSEGRTLSSYLGEVNLFMAWLADSGITTLTSGNDIELSNFDEAPNVLFLKIPDQLKNRYKLVSLFITQMYKALVSKAEKNKKEGKMTEQKLLRNTYLMMDEFGNLPKLHLIDRIATIGRGRGIFMIPIIQDFNQLTDIYGRETANTIRSNSNIQLFIGTNDADTIKVFSEQCGKKKVKQINYSENLRDMNVSTSAQSVPLIYPSELEQLNDPANGKSGNMIALCLGTYPIKSKFTPIYEAQDIYAATSRDVVPAELIRFDEEYYDIARYNAFVNADSNPQSSADNEEEITQGENVEQEQENTRKGIKPRTVVEITIDNKINELEGRIPKETLRELLSSSIERKLQIINTLISDTESSALMFDLIKLQTLLQAAASVKEINNNE